MHYTKLAWKDATGDHKLLTPELRSQLPALGTTAMEADPTVWMQYFSPSSYAEWYVIEFDGKDIFYGLVILDYIAVLGHFSLGRLASIDVMGYPAIEPVVGFEPMPLSQVWGIP
jgi:hypothetical protein